MAVLFPPAGVVVYSVGELTRAIKELLEDAHPSVSVQVDVSNAPRPARGAARPPTPPPPASGPLYLTLKDELAPLRTVVYRGVALRMRYDLRDGMQVVARGRLSVYEPRGEYQFIVEEIQPRGIGPLELAFRQLKERLSVLGYFDPARKKPLPRYPRRVCLVTSPTGSAVRGPLQVLGRRWRALEVWVCPVRVQGDGAAAEIAAALDLLDRLAGEIDVIILARGGGSIEDLWPFNEEAVAHAIHRSRIPVVTGVGHEDDLTIADLVADARALTPSEAAERVAPDRAEVTQTLEGLRGRLRFLLTRRLEEAKARLTQLADRPSFRRPLERVRDGERRLDDLGERLRRALGRLVERGRQRLE